MDIRDEFQAVQEPCGPAGAMQTIVFHRDERLTNPHKLEVARRHGVPLADDDA